MAEPMLEIKSIKISDLLRQLADALDKVGTSKMEHVYDEDGDVRTIGEHLMPLLIKARHLTIVLSGGRLPALGPPREECVDMDSLVD